MIKSAPAVCSSAPSAFVHPSFQVQACSRAQGWNPTNASFRLSPVSTLPHSQSPVPTQPQPFPLRHDLTRRCRCRDTKHVAHGARWHCRAPRAGCGAHGGESSVRWPCTLHVLHSVLHSMPRVMPHSPATRRSAHQQLPCSPSTAATPASTAGTGGESATCTCHAAMRWKTAYTCEYLVHDAGLRLRSAHCRRSIQTSRRQIRSLKPLSAAQVMRRSETVAARSAHSYDTCTRTRLPRTRVRVRWMCQREPHVDTPSTPCWAPCGGSHTRVGSHAGWDTSGYRYARRSSPGRV
jgi:hypothetical protein